MTEKLYYQDSYAAEFDAEVVSCLPGKDGWQIVLNRTLFYPEGGGQPGDTGALEAEDGTVFDIIDTHEKDGEVLHFCKAEIPAGTFVHGTIDFSRRMDQTQQHSGEHIISGIICRRFSCSNVGFHMGAETVTIDYDANPTWEELMEAEAEANEAIRRNEPFDIFIPSPEELKKLTYRSKKELTGPVRIVKAGTKDICACCGTHVRTAGEVGIIKLISMKKLRGGVRLELLCGKRAYDYLSAVFRQNSEVSSLLSARPLETAATLRSYMERSAAEHSRLAELEDKMADITAAQYQGKGSCLHFEAGLEGDSLRRLTEKCAVACGGRAAVFAEAADGFKYCAICKEGGMRALASKINAALNGRGGGRDDCIQGSCAAGEPEIRKFFEELGG